MKPVLTALMERFKMLDHAKEEELWLGEPERRQESGDQSEAFGGNRRGRGLERERSHKPHRERERDQRVDRALRPLSPASSEPDASQNS